MMSWQALACYVLIPDLRFEIFSLRPCEDSEDFQQPPVSLLFPTQATSLQRVVRVRSSAIFRGGYWS